MQISAAPKAGKGPGGTFPLLKEGTNYAKKKTVSGLFCLPGIILFITFFIVPFLVGFRYSFTNWNFRRADFIGLENYISIL